MLPHQHKHPSTPEQHLENLLAKKYNRLKNKPVNAKSPRVQELLKEILIVASMKYFVSPTKTRTVDSARALGGIRNAEQHQFQALLAQAAEEQAAWCLLHGLDSDS
eukprot:2977675-Karenia_brevis.AAC.1